MNRSSRIAVLGGGSWATAIVKILLENVQSINWYLRRQENIDYIKEHKHNQNYLSSVNFFTEKIIFFNDLNDLVKQSDILIMAIPSQFMDSVMASLTEDISDKFIISAIKGIIPQYNLTTAEYFNQIHKIDFGSIAIISGPCHAEEIALERLSYLTISSKYREKAVFIAGLMKTSYVNVVVSKDIYGTEYAGILKNIFAIASGICHGLGYGDNFQAVLVANAHQEMKRFLDKTYKNKNKRKLNSSSYLGDLMVTAYSQFSRNRTFGTMIGKGYSVRTAQLEMNMIAEGYNAVKCIQEINKEYNVKMPITDAVYNILYQRISPSVEIKILTEKLH